MTALPAKRKTRTSYFGNVATNCLPCSHFLCVIFPAASRRRILPIGRPSNESAYSRMDETDALRVGCFRSVVLRIESLFCPTAKLSDAGGPQRPDLQATCSARIRSGDLVGPRNHGRLWLLELPQSKNPLAIWSLAF